MSIQIAVNELLQERTRIDKALAALEVKKPGPAPARPASSPSGKRTFTMSAEAKAKIAKAQKDRWAKIKKSMTGKTAATKAA